MRSVRRRWRGEVPPADFASFPGAAARLRCTELDVYPLLAATPASPGVAGRVAGIERGSLERTVRWGATARFWRLRTALRVRYGPCWQVRSRRAANHPAMRRGMIATVLAATLAGGPAAGAGPDTAPAMTASGGRQRGAVMTTTTTQRHGDACSALIADGVAETPPAVAHDGSALSWRVADRRQPKATLTAERYVAEPLVALTPRAPRELRVTVTPVRSRGRVIAWTVTSERVGDGDFRLVLAVRWPGACGDDQGTYVFHTATPLLP